MILNNYKNLIHEHPVRQQSFTTKLDNEKWIWAEKGFNKKKYFSYLEDMNEISKRLGTNGENIEQFLFVFGNNLKV